MWSRERCTRCAAPSALPASLGQTQACSPHTTAPSSSEYLGGAEAKGSALRWQRGRELQARCPPQHPHISWAEDRA